MTTEYDPTVRHVRVLHGHTSEETAYLVDDYPHGFRLRVKIRYWIETAEKGAKKGQQRFMSQTTDPRRDSAVWLKPQASTYVGMAWMFLDHNNHVQWTGVGVHVSPEQDARLRLSGIYGQMAEKDLRMYDVLVALARKRYARPWEEWKELLDYVRAYHAEHGKLPEVTNSTIEMNGHPKYIRDWPAVVAEVCGPENFRVDVLAKGESSWVSNGLRFGTIEEAKAYGRDLFSRWTQVERWSIVPESTPEHEPYVEGERKVTP